MAIADQWTFKEQPSSPMPFDRIEKLRDRQKLLDFKIIANDGHEVAANRFLLATRFPRIADTVTADEQARMEWRRFSANIVEAAVTFAYTGRVEITMRNVASLFLLSTNLGCSTLTSGCIEFLRPRLSEDNVEIFWSIANATMNADLMSVCVPAIAANFDAFTARPKFYSSTDAEYLALVLSDDRLTHVTEESKLRVIANWFGNARPDDSTDCFEELVGTLDLGNISSDNFVDICTSTCVVNLPKTYRDCLVNVWKRAEKPVISRKSPSPTKASNGTFRDNDSAFKPGHRRSKSSTSINSLNRPTNFYLQSRKECAVPSLNDSSHRVGLLERKNIDSDATSEFPLLKAYFGRPSAARASIPPNDSSHRVGMLERKNIDSDATSEFAPLVLFTGGPSAPRASIPPYGSSHRVGLLGRRRNASAARSKFAPLNVVTGGPSAARASIPPYENDLNVRQMARRNSITDRRRAWLEPPIL